MTPANITVTKVLKRFLQQRSGTRRECVPPRQWLASTLIIQSALSCFMGSHSDCRGGMFLRWQPPKGKNYDCDDENFWISDWFPSWAGFIYTCFLLVTLDLWGASSFFFSSALFPAFSILSSSVSCPRFYSHSFPPPHIPVSASCVT